jgi:cobalamin biosynthesis protein CobW
MTAPRIPVTVVTGFLGAGKTTLLSNLLGNARNWRLAILVNEFGEISIDGAILRDRELLGHVEIHDVSNGLVAYGDDTDFLPIMLAILERRQMFDHVLIETSGLALPTAVMERLQGDELKDHFVLDATLAIVDTPLLLAGGFGAEGHADSGLSAQADRSVSDLFVQQMANADIVILNKIDALGEDGLLEAEHKVRALAPGLRFIELAYGAKLDTKLTLGLRLHEAASTKRSLHFGPVPSFPGTLSHPLASHAGLDGHTHTGLGAHVHGLATHKHFHEQDPGWQSFVIRTKQSQNAERLVRAVERIAREEPMLRVKGYVTLCGGERILIQGVRTRIDIQTQPPSREGAPSQLVFIGYHPSRTNVVTYLNDLTGTNWR